MAFKLGRTLMTYTVSHAMEVNPNFKHDVFGSFARYVKEDWGDLDEYDKLLNDKAVKENNDRIFAKYYTCGDPIYIITDRNRETTTIMLCSDY